MVACSSRFECSTHVGSIYTDIQLWLDTWDASSWDFSDIYSFSYMLMGYPSAHFMRRVLYISESRSKHPKPHKERRATFWTILVHICVFAGLGARACVCACVCVCVCIYIYIYMIKISGKLDKSNTYNGFSDNISFFINRKTSSVNKERNITTKPVVSVNQTLTTGLVVIFRSFQLIFIFLSDSPKSTIFPYIYIYIYN